VSVQSIRAAYFTDTYLEIDGVANTARQFEAYAKRHGVPFLILHGGYTKEALVRDGSVMRAELPRGRVGITIDRNHEFDVLFLRHLSRAEQIVREFKPDVLHITGPSDVGLLGALVAHRLKIPLVGSWHTNVHEYAERRALPLLFSLPKRWRANVGQRIGEGTLQIVSRLYKIPRVLMAPNRELIELLEKKTGKPCFLMSRGVDTELFHPSKRDREGGPFLIGYVGRITLEKNVELLIEIERGLKAADISGYQFLIVGQGASEASLRANLPGAEFTGVLRGEQLARAYAQMDAFVFPSTTDTFGNVVLEAMASCVVALVTNKGGPQFIVSSGINGFVCPDTGAFVENIRRIKDSPEELKNLREAARRHAESASWDNVFDAVYRAYQVALDSKAPLKDNLLLKLRPRGEVKM